MPQRARRTKGEAPVTLYTIGHSTHPLEHFLALLAQHQIAALADVRSFPASRRWPQFNRATLADAVMHAGIRYQWIQRLGGRRHHVDPASPHTAWTVRAFRAYADYVATADFEAGLAELLATAAEARTAYMCGEGLWWRCHRRIISDCLLARGYEVRHILPNGKLVEHRLPEFAKIVDGRVIYSGA